MQEMRRKLRELSSAALKDSSVEDTASVVVEWLECLAEEVGRATAFGILSGLSIEKAVQAVARGRLLGLREVSTLHDEGCNGCEAGEILKVEAFPN